MTDIGFVIPAPGSELAPGSIRGPGLQHPVSSATPPLDCGSWPAMTKPTPAMNRPVVIPDFRFAILDAQFAIPDAQFVIPNAQLVIPDLIRDPVPHHHWIADRVCPGLRSGVRNDSRGCHDKSSCFRLRTWLVLFVWLWAVLQSSKNAHQATSSARQKPARGQAR